LSLGSFTFSTHIDTNPNEPISNACTYKIALNTVLEVGIIFEVKIKNKD
jgi:hypothetical protein